MLNEEKVRLMAKAEAYEQTEGKERIKANENFEKGADFRVLLGNIPMGIITFFLLAGTIYVVADEELKNIYRNIGPVFSTIIVIIGFVIFVGAYALYSRHMQKKEYEYKRGTFFKYSFNKSKIKEQAEE